ncbi:MAG TPA: FKBP-type peptidyl-prolyl cis-trans isomerase [Methanocorpusculum sp.]|nr:FKBP-type peptidyl-prolyl cis-trans isomerase [Methanocorpusculum sp.]
MAPVTEHDTLLLHFRSRREDGSIFEDTSDREPQKVHLGDGTINLAFEEALLGKEAGDTVTVVLPPEKAYGVRNKHLVFPIKRKKLNLDHEPSVGDIFTLTIKGIKGAVMIKEVTPTKIVVDANHPLAGETISYELTIVENLGTESADQ